MCTQAATEWGNICMVMADLNLASLTTNNPYLFVFVRFLEEIEDTKKMFWN